MATLKDIAKALDLGVSTVSMALNGHARISERTRRIVMSKARELGYVKNGNAVDLQRQSTNLILLIVSDASRSYFSKIIEAVQIEVAKHGYNLLIIPTEGSTSTAERFISEHRADGAIVFTNRIMDDFLELYAREDFPIFNLGHYIEHDHIYCGASSSTLDKGSGMAVDYLLAKGHKRIAFVKGSMKTRGTPRRFEGYKRALKENHIPYDASLIFDAKDSSYEAGYAIASDLYEHRDRIDGICFTNDDIAIGALRYFNEHDIKIPEVFSLIGNNNLPESNLVTPALTTVDNGQVEGVIYGVSVLVNAIENGRVDKTMLKVPLVNEKVIERNTVSTIRR